ncbi:MAG: hypothetical protein CVU11_14595 [Bacteroidetes bacterium HGW-Bacteroidetes-6]|jgi:hypothetical protein|nr:MAG: hypothetical protein CVU11_14595 [Bacteroidetes bacterium HGW-Bacteroidetes-6]
MKTILTSTIILLLFAGSLSAQNVYSVSVAANAGSLLQKTEIANDPEIIITELSISINSFIFIYLNSEGNLIDFPSSNNNFTQTMFNAIADPNVKYFWIDEAVFMFNGTQYTAATKKIELSD